LLLNRGKTSGSHHTPEPTPTDFTVALPKQALQALLKILDRMADGSSATVLDSDLKISILEVAEMYSVSEYKLLNLLEVYQIPLQKGTHSTTLKVSDFSRFQDRLQAKRESELQFLADQAQDLSLGYDEVQK
jgi:hypothetical protein